VRLQTGSWPNVCFNVVFGDPTSVDMGWWWGWGWKEVVVLFGAVEKKFSEFLLGLEK